MDFDPDGLLDGLPPPVLIQVHPVIDPSVRGLCPRAYNKHPKGCPNFNKCDRCPPKAPMFDRAYDMSKPVYAVVNSFDLGGHVSRLKATPKKDGSIRSDDEAKCVLYWQGKARSQLNRLIKIAAVPTGYTATWCPEGMGVNVTATLAAVGIHLEWPAVRIARQVALMGVPLDGSAER